MILCASTAISGVAVLPVDERRSAVHRQVALPAKFSAAVKRGIEAAVDDRRTADGPAAGEHSREGHGGRAAAAE